MQRTSTISGLSFLLVALEACSAAPTSSGEAPEGIASTSSALPGDGMIRGLGDKCLDVKAGGTSPGTPVQLWQCFGNPDQMWRFTAAGEIRGLGDQCLDVSGGGTANGTLVQMWTCQSGNPNQQWRRLPNGEIQGLGGNCLDVPGGNANDGQRLQMWSCIGNANQMWKFDTAVSVCAPHDLGSFAAKWHGMGGNSSWLGCPTTDAKPNPDNTWYAIFEHGAIYQYGSQIVAMEEHILRRVADYVQLYWDAGCRFLPSQWRVGQFND